MPPLSLTLHGDFHRLVVFNAPQGLDVACCRHGPAALAVLLMGRSEGLAIHILGHLSPHNTLRDKGKDAKSSKETTFLARVNFPAPAASSLSWAGTQTSGVLVRTLSDLGQAPRPLVLRVPLWEIKAKSLPCPSPSIPG
ncbi:hypothetical protein PAL_GLEAN10011356 [Pteropus alecto]|uniref:Uncharacterized protein n=1 Tax=Pteropus alecto TaxID=9402 RepID=L5KRC0_PTEAL|nr:hypothetical protein PAL_GLEAN10011356 [Pteropus alecto]